MATFNFYIHGVPVGHEIYGPQEDQNFLSRFYNHDEEHKENAYMQVNVYNGKSFYTYIHNRNISNSEGRSGSFFAMTISFNGQYCISAYKLYQLFDAVYRQLCIDVFVAEKPDGGKLLVKELSKAIIKGNNAYKYIEAVMKNNVENYSFASLDDVQQSSRIFKYNLNEVDSPAFIAAFKSAVVRISPEYTSLAEVYNAYQQQATKWAEERKTLERENKSNLVTISALQKNIKELEETISSLQKGNDSKWATIIDKLKQEKKELKDSLDKAFKDLEKSEVYKSAYASIDKTVEEVRQQAGRFPEKDPEIPKAPTKKILPIINLILLVLVLLLSGVNAWQLRKPAQVATTQESAKTETKEEEKPVVVENPVTFELLTKVCPNAKIDLGGFSGTIGLQSGIKYSLKTKNAPEYDYGDYEVVSGPATIDTNSKALIINSDAKVGEKVKIKYTCNLHYIEREEEVKRAVQPNAQAPKTTNNSPKPKASSETTV